MSSFSIWAAAALTPERELERVRLRIEGGKIAELEAGCAPGPGDRVFENAKLAPGLIDLQVNGAVGAAYATADPLERIRATRFHLEHGTTSLLATLVSAPLEALCAAAARLAPEVDPGGPLLGIHLEGPFLAPEKSGAHAQAALCDPTAARVEQLLEAAGPGLRMLTLAPERPGALEATERLARAGVVVAAGHSVARLDQLRRAVDRGLSFVTHLGNASDWPSRPVDPELGFRVSEPGLVGGFMLEPRLRGSLILDGFHLHPELAAALVALRGVTQLALVSDATPAAGQPPGHYELGGLELRVHAEGYATSGQGLAGSLIPLLGAVRTAVERSPLTLAQALRMATLTPAEVIGVDTRKGRLEAGYDADLLLLGPALELLEVYRAGEPLAAP
ncbi:MAG: amidohydrolase family protein [Myxococcales bacterium]|nr:amidohydrolase family protein [Myxococcales bacterium]